MRVGWPTAFQIWSEMTVTSAPVSMLNITGFPSGPSEARKGWGGHRSDNNRVVATNLQAVQLIQFPESCHAKCAEVGGAGSIPPPGKFCIDAF